jgi:hypothetical protein
VTSPRAAQRRRIRADSLGPWLVAGAIAWIGVAWIGWTLWQADPRRAGFDLTLLLEAARQVLAGESPYDPAMLAGSAPDAVELFYSYPPPVAQAMTLLAWLPNGVVLVLWAIGAALGVGLVAALTARSRGMHPGRMAIRAVAVVPLVLPFAIAVLFGNLDAWYPLAYGALLLTVLPGAGPRTRIGAGIAIALVSIAKLHPAPLLLWVAVVVLRDRGGPQARVLAAAVVTGAVVLIASLVVGGIQPWLDYVQVARTGAGADLVDPRNIGPVSLIGQATGMDHVALRWVQVAVTLGVVAVTVLVALRVRSPLLAMGLVTVASLVTLPVTWYHYPVALIPLAIALTLWHPAARPRVLLAAGILVVAIAWLPLTWLAIAVLLVVAGEVSVRGARGPRPMPATP